MAKDVIVKQVDVMGLMGALRTKGKAKLSDFATPIENETNNQNQKEDKDMKPETSNMTTTFKAADLIGKTIILGATGAKYVVKSVNGDKLECDFSNGKATIPMSVPVAQAEKFLASGTWKIEGAIANENENQNQNENKPAAPETKDMSIRTEADVAEVDDILPVVTPKAKAEGGSKTADVPQTSDIKPQTSEKPAPKVKIKSETKPQTSSVSPQTSKGKLTYSTYDVVKKNKETGEDYTVQNAKIAGFDLTDAAYLAGASFNGGLLPETIDGKQVGTLRFSHKWREAAKAICDKLNAGGTVQDCVAIMEQAKADRKQKINERIQKREARKAKREERKAKAQTPETRNLKPETKVYTQTELAEWLRKLNAGTDKEKAEAAKFFNDLAKAA